jgi:hypothetical protein
MLVLKLVILVVVVREKSLKIVPTRVLKEERFWDGNATSFTLR